jgi:addiction module HigA family antidote
MVPENRVPTHPGEILLEEFLKPLELTQVALAAKLGIPIQRVNELVRGKRGVTPQTAWLLAREFDTSPQFWMNLQTNHDLAKARPATPLVVPTRSEGPKYSAHGRLCGAQRLSVEPAIVEER